MLAVAAGCQKKTQQQMDADQKGIDQLFSHKDEYSIVPIDGCQYIRYDYGKGLLHKQNCKNH